MNAIQEGFVGNYYLTWTHIGSLLALSAFLLAAVGALLWQLNSEGKWVEWIIGASLAGVLVFGFGAVLFLGAAAECGPGDAVHALSLGKAQPCGVANVHYLTKNTMYTAWTTAIVESQHCLTVEVDDGGLPLRPGAKVSYVVADNAGFLCMAPADGGEGRFGQCVEARTPVGRAN